MATKPVQLNIGFSNFFDRRSTDRLPIDSVLFLSTLTLLIIGLVMMTSASIMLADNNFGNPFYYLQKQSMFILIGIVAGYIVWRLPLQVWNTLRLILLMFGILLLGIVLIPGVGQEVNGSVRWIRIGGFNVQISEFIKIVIIIFLAGYINKHQDALKKSAAAVLLPMFILCFVALLLILEPDLGATVVIFATGMSMFMLAGVRLKVFILMLAFAVGGFFLLAYAESYRVERLIAFKDPWLDPFNSGFQLSQSLIAFGRGEWFGVGLGESIQKMLYLPEAHTDFLFAIIAEELGVIGVLTVIGLYAVVAWRALFIGRAAQKNEQHFAAFIAYGVGSWLVFQAYVNIGVNMGVLPTKGLTLPLMSYGGSSIVMSLIAIALLMRVDYELRFQYSEKGKERRASC